MYCTVNGKKTTYDKARTAMLKGGQSVSIRFN
jgi:hypothetical protein